MARNDSRILKNIINETEHFQYICALTKTINLDSNCEVLTNLNQAAISYGNINLVILLYIYANAQAIRILLKFKNQPIFVRLLRKEGH